MTSEIPHFTDEQIDHLNDRFSQLIGELVSVFDEVAARARQIREEPNPDDGDLAALAEVQALRDDYLGAGRGDEGDHR